MHVKIEGLDTGAWDFPWDHSPSTRQFLRQVPFEQCRAFASIGDWAAPAALVAASSYAEHVTAFELSPAAADRITRSAARNRLTNCSPLRDELWQSNQYFDTIVARCYLTSGLFTDAIAKLAPGGRIYLSGPAPTGDWAAEIRTWLPPGTLLFSASQSNGWLEVHAERLDAVLESAA